MNNKKTIEIKGNEEIAGGEVILRKPKAREKNSAMMKAETPVEINGVIKCVVKESVFMVELLPMCVQVHPWQTIPIKNALGSLDTDQYDKLVTALAELISTDFEETKKKSKIVSESEETVKVGQ